MSGLSNLLCGSRPISLHPCPRLKALALIAARHDLNFAIDAEEADRLALSMKLVERLAHEPELGAWRGLGVVVQAYQKRGMAVIAGLRDLARRSGRRIMIRLVKGAYWDSEIKRAQVSGMPDYPVFTTKAATDLSYLACAKELIAAAPDLYPQFATHNAHTLAAVRHMAEQANVPIEHQRLHGMGEALYEAAEKTYGHLTLRAYAPVGGHEDLLPYLVRRLLENGANSSFAGASGRRRDRLRLRFSWPALLRSANAVRSARQRRQHYRMLNWSP